MRAWGEADLGVGIEAGLFETPAAGGLMDVQACVVADGAGRLTYGHGPGFTYPAEVVRKLREGASVGDVMKALTGVTDIGQKEGAVGFLSRGHVTRAQLTEPAVLMAFLPRMRPEFYAL
jgi:inosine/xanthosine triphosphatase